MTQPALFPEFAEPPAPVLRGYTLTVQLPGDGRALLWLKTERGPAWAELLPAARAWLAERLQTGEAAQFGAE